MLESIAQDLKYAVRQLSNAPGFTLIAVLSLALGIGANAAIFKLIDVIHLRALPVREPATLANIDFTRGSSLMGRFSSRSARLTYTQFEQIQTQQLGFEKVFAWSAARFNLSAAGEARFAEGLYVTGNFFAGLGVPAYIGRTIAEADDTGACPNPGAVLSYAFWQREFGADPGILDRTIRLDGQRFPVIGVTGGRFFGPEVGNGFDVAIPLCADRIMAEDQKGRIPSRIDWWLSAMGRLKPGWTLDRASAQLRAVSPSILQASIPPEFQQPEVNRYVKNILEATKGANGVSGLRRQYERPLWILMSITALVLLIACANLANLLLARASARERETAVRLAIGASRARLVRQFLVESLLIGCAGAAIGGVLAQILATALVAFLTTSGNRIFLDLSPDWRVTGFCAASAILTCILFGLTPAIRATAAAPSSAMRSSGRGTTAGRERLTLRRFLVAFQVALSVVLLAGALLFVRSLQNLMSADLGFKPEGIVTVGIDFGKTGIPQERRLQTYHDLLSKLSGVPGVVSAAQVLLVPVSGNGWNQGIGPDGMPAAGGGKMAWFNRVSPGYFSTMGMRLVAGRDFDQRDVNGATKVAVVNEAFAQKYFGGSNPVGRVFRMDAPAGKPEPVIQIAGMVGNTRYNEVREDALPIVFLPIEQDAAPGPGASFTVRASGSPMALIGGLKSAIASVNPGLGVEFQSFSRQLEESLLRERLMATLSSAFGFLAAALATLGLYGTISYMVERRRSEIGVRMALGADRPTVVGLVLREAVVLLVIGSAGGVLIALWAGRAASNLLYGVQPDRKSVV